MNKLRIRHIFVQFYDHWIIVSIRQKKKINFMRNGDVQRFGIVISHNFNNYNS